MTTQHILRFTPAALLATALVLPMGAHGALLGGVDFEGANTSTFDRTPDDADGTDGITFSSGNGTNLFDGWTIVTTTGGNGASGNLRDDNGAKTAGATTPDFPARLEGSRVGSFSFTIPDGVILDLDRIVFDVRGATGGGGGNSGRDVQFRTSLEGETEYLYENLNLPARNNNSNDDWLNIDLDLTDAKYDGLTNQTIDIIFRTPGGGIDLDTILIYGTIVPEPTSLALLGLGGLLIAQRRRG